MAKKDLEAKRLVEAAKLKKKWNKCFVSLFYFSFIQ